MSDAKEKPSFVTVRQIADDLGVSPMTVYREIHSGRLKANRINRVFRVDRDAYEEYRRLTLYTPPTSR